MLPPCSLLGHLGVPDSEFGDGYGDAAGIRTEAAERASAGSEYISCSVYSDGHGRRQDVATARCWRSRFPWAALLVGSLWSCLPLLSGWLVTVLWRSCGAAGGTASGLREFLRWSHGEAPCRSRSTFPRRWAMAGLGGARTRRQLGAGGRFEPLGPGVPGRVCDCYRAGLQRRCAESAGGLWCGGWNSWLA